MPIQRKSIFAVESFSKLISVSCTCMCLQWTREGMATLAALNVLVNPYVSPSWVHSYDDHCNFSVSCIVKLMSLLIILYRERSKATQYGLMPTEWNHSSTRTVNLQLHAQALLTQKPWVRTSFALSLESNIFVNKTR